MSKKTDNIIVEGEKNENAQLDNDLKVEIPNIEDFVDPEEKENTPTLNISNYKDIMDTVEVISLVYKGEIEKIKRPISNVDNYDIYIKTINECIIEGTGVLNELNKNNKGNMSFELWAELSSKILPLIRKVYMKYQDISEWNSKKRLELALIIILEIIFNHYYVLYSNNNLLEEDNNVLHYIFSEEGQLALKCICNATVALFNEIDENGDGEISISEIKKCCSKPSKWLKVIFACFPKKK